ncbi:MotA/TolQ/ExbB proton channel family protein [Iodidimonas sp. MBR-22]|jgi:biopolymer transport protein ExbB|uniref:MotA/TolQ/ExbB proton channel family protein n=1 Tax=unclassified Iodidimonas TaxID=2626145 RepID=UPI0032B2B88A
MVVQSLLDALTAIQIFMEKGGVVLYGVLAVTFVMWILIIERIWYFTVNAKLDVKQALSAWESRDERRSWYAHKVRTAMISEVSQNLNTNIDLIKTLVATCPLVGLLGTVTGMVSVFDVMAVLGSGNARAMADGVSKATIPTMAGMVAALSGVFMSTWIERKAKSQAERLEDTLTMDH